MLQDLIPGSPKFSKDFDGKAFSNVLKIFDICLELPSDSEKYFGFLVDEFSEFVHTRKSRCLQHLELFVARSASQKRTEFKRRFSFKRSGSI